METPERILSETTRLYKKWNGGSEGRIQVEFAPLIPWGCTNETMLETYQLSRAWGTGTHIHVAETREEVEINLEKGTILCRAGEFSFPPLPEAVMEIFDAGGLIPYTKKRLQKSN